MAVWAFCNAAQPLLLAKSALVDELSKGTVISVNKPPAHKLTTRWKVNFIEPENDFLVSSKVNKNGAISKIRFKVLAVICKFKFLVKSLRSALAKVINTKLAHKVKKLKAPLLRSTKTNTAGAKTKIAKMISAISRILT